MMRKPPCSSQIQDGKAGQMRHLGVRGVEVGERRFLATGSIMEETFFSELKALPLSEAQIAKKASIEADLKATLNGRFKLTVSVRKFQAHG
jgi:hypothetical protein